MAPGACCSGPLSCAVVLDRDTCEQIFFGTFFEGFDCDQVTCETNEVLGACCLPDGGGCRFVPRVGQLFPTPTEGCLELGGDFLGEGIRCEVPDADPPRTLCDPPPPPEGCFTAREDRPSGRPAWSPNQCQNAVLMPTRQAARTGPPPDPPLGEPLFDITMFFLLGVTGGGFRTTEGRIELFTNLETLFLPYEQFPTLNDLDVAVAAWDSVHWSLATGLANRNLPSSLIAAGQVGEFIGDLSATLVVRRVPQEAPAEDPEGDGDWGVATPHKVRAKPGNPNSEDPCTFHRGAIVIGQDGFARAAMCSQPDWQDEESTQWSLDDLHIADGTDPNGLVEPGDAFWIGGYGAPLFTEAHLRSHKKRCSLLR